MSHTLKALALAASIAFSFASALATAQERATTEVVYSTFLDPNNPNDPRAAAQTKMIAEFERRHPDTRIKLFLDPSIQNSTRAVRSGQSSPDIFRVMAFLAPEFVATGNIEPLDALIQRDKVDMKDWLLPAESNKINGKTYGLFQDYRIPLLLYRKSRLAEANVAPPKTWDEVCQAGAMLSSKGPLVGYALGIGASGGVGGAQGFAEYVLASMLIADGGGYFKDDNRTIAFSRDALVKAAVTVRDLYGKCKAVPLTSLQYGSQEPHDGLRSNTIAMTNFGLYRYRSIQKQGAGDDLAWAPPPSFTKDGKEAMSGFQLMLNARSKVKAQGWEFVKFMASAEAQAMAARGGEVVARASVYKDAYFATAEGADQLAWAGLIKARGQIVSYPVIAAAFHQILGDSFQRMILRNATPEATADEIFAKYREAIEKTK